VIDGVKMPTKIQDGHYHCVPICTTHTNTLEPTLSLHDWHTLYSCIGKIWKTQDGGIKPEVNIRFIPHRNSTSHLRF
jgi:hypothetical protein